MTLKHYGYMRSLLQTHASLNTGRKISCGIRDQPQPGIAANRRQDKDRPTRLFDLVFMEAVIEQQAQAFKVTEKVSLGKVADFKILREVLAEPRKGR